MGAVIGWTWLIYGVDECRVTTGQAKVIKYTQSLMRCYNAGILELGEMKIMN
jgi:hypothetical protein